MPQQPEHNDEILFEINTDANDFEHSEIQGNASSSDTKKTSKSMNQITTKKRCNAKKVFLIIGIVILVLAGFVGYMIMFQPHIVEQKCPFFAKETTSVIPASSVMINNYQSLETKHLMTETELLAQISADLNPRPQPVVIRPVPRIVTRGFIQTPTWVIVTNTFTNEAQAIRTVAQNSKKGVRTGGYFWAPDYIPGASGNFRTYIGFFDTKEDAELRIENEPAITQMFPNATIQRLQ
jgi:hypothetical protein